MSFSCSIIFCLYPFSSIFLAFFCSACIFKIKLYAFFNIPFASSTLDVNSTDGI